MSKEGKNNLSRSYKRLVFDELCANFITLSKNRIRIKKEKAEKIFKKILSTNIKSASI